MCDLLHGLRLHLLGVLFFRLGGLVAGLADGFYYSSGEGTMVLSILDAFDRLCGLGLVVVRNKQRLRRDIIRLHLSLDLVPILSTLFQDLLASCSFLIFLQVRRVVRPVHLLHQL
mmetsp:Transcript_33060/g.50697  ORF Transcript_33060/g.50697 Transcript_33060/m.50697 type:complete len:115 (-) Transcript_33060:1015-1359(-)